MVFSTYKQNVTVQKWAHTKVVCSLFFLFCKSNQNRGSYIGAHVLLNFLNELGKRDKMRGFNKTSPSFL